MVVSEHPKVIEGRQRLIATDFLESEEASDYGSIYGDGADTDEEDESGWGEAGVSTVVTELVTKVVEEVQQSVKSDSFPPYMLKPTSLITQGFK